MATKQRRRKESVKGKSKVVVQSEEDQRAGVYPAHKSGDGFVVRQKLNGKRVA